MGQLSELTFRMFNAKSAKSAKRWGRERGTGLNAESAECDAKVAEGSWEGAGTCVD